MRAACLTAVALLAFIGCNSEQLRYTTLRLGQSIPDLQERQVIDNLARIADSPGNLPYYTVINVGTANIQDSGGTGLTALTLQHKAFPLSTGNATTSRSVTGNWTLNPMSNPDRIRAMRAAYHIALGAEVVDPLDLTKLDAVLKDQKGLEIRRGWLCVGGKHDVPREASIVAHHGKTYVWVMPQRSKEFADFALVMLNIATWTAPSPTPELNLTIAPITFGDRPLLNAPKSFGARPESSQPGTASAPLEFPTPEPHPIPRRLYEDSQTINRGLFFVPR